MEFVVAEDDVWFSAFDVFPQVEEASDELTVREVRFPVSATEQLHISWDTIMRSARIRYRRASDVVVDVYREQVTRLTVETHKTGPVIAVDYHAEDCDGRTRVHVRPAFALRDTFLRA